MDKKLIYLDTCVLSRITDLKFESDIANALEKICDSEKTELVTSDKTLEEFNNVKNDKKKTAFRLIYKLISKIQKKNPIIVTNSALFGDALFGSVPFGGDDSHVDELLIELNKFFDKDDSDHIYQAIKNDCDYFLTLDYKTIINRYKRNKTEIDSLLSKTKIVDPIDLESQI